MDPFGHEDPFEARDPSGHESKPIFGGIFVPPGMTPGPPKTEPPGLFDRILKYAIKIIGALLSFYLIAILLIYVYPTIVAAFVTARRISRYFLKFY